MPYVFQIFLKNRLSLYLDGGVQISKVPNSKKYSTNQQYAVQIELDFSDYYTSCTYINSCHCCCFIESNISFECLEHIQRYKLPLGKMI